MAPKDIFCRFDSLRILVVGDIMLDHYIWGEVSRISPEAPVPVVNVLRESNTAGGAANVALNLASLGVKVELIGTLGKDAAADELGVMLGRKGVVMERCMISADGPTIVKTRLIARTQQLCRVDREAARSVYALDLNDALSEALADAVSQADAVIISDYAKGVVTQALVDEILRLGNSLGKLTAIDPKPSRKLNFRGVGVMTPNRNEALELAGLVVGCDNEVDLEDLAQRIHQLYCPGLLVITLGADGMVITRGGKVEKKMPTKAREVFDVSGAGDTVIAALVAALAAGASSESAAFIANTAAGIVVGKVGTATTTREEIMAELMA